MIKITIVIKNNESFGLFLNLFLMDEMKLVIFSLVKTPRCIKNKINIISINISERQAEKKLKKWKISNIKQNEIQIDKPIPKDITKISKKLMSHSFLLIFLKKYKKIYPKIEIKITKRKKVKKTKKKIKKYHS